MYTVAVCEDQKDTREEAAALCGEVLTDLKIEHRIAAFSSAEDLETQLQKKASRLERKPNNIFHSLFSNKM